MDLWMILLVVAAVVIVAGLTWWFGLRRRSEALKERFGPEYDRTIEESDSRMKAERDLRERERRVEKLDIRPLDPDRALEHRGAWEQIERDFVDSPGPAVRDADRLLITVMRERGYPVEDFDERSADLSVNHPQLVENYRAAHEVAEQHHEGRADTEQLRQAVIHYRALFEDLLEADRDPKGP